MTRFLLFTLVLGFLVSCGKGEAPKTQASPKQLDAIETKATLALFGAPWCSVCKSSFPKIRDLLAAAPEARRNALTVQLYVTTGSKLNDHPTQEIADAYRDFFQLPAQALADPWKWRTFRDMVSKVDLELPGAAVISPDGRVLKSFEAGPATFVPEEIVAFALESAK